MKNTIRNTVEEVYDTNVNNFKSNPSISASQFVKIVPREKNIDIRNLETNSVHHQNTDSGSFLFVFFGILLVGFLGAMFYFRDKIKPHLDKIFGSSPKKSKEVDEEKKTIKKEKEEEEKVEKPPVTEKKAPITNKPKNINKSDYSNNQIVKQDDMYCYVGEDDNMRQCIEVFKDDICTSGDIFNRIDQCLVPKKE